MSGPAGGAGDADLRRRVARLSVEQKIRLLTGADFWALAPEPDAGLRRVVLSDGPAGVRGETWDERDTSANVPSRTALAASWDARLPALVRPGLDARAWHLRALGRAFVGVAPAGRIRRTHLAGLSPDDAQDGDALARAS